MLKRRWNKLTTMVSGQKGGSQCRSTLRRKRPKVADCLKDSLDNSEMLIEESQITEGERSPTRMETAAVVADERVEIQFNDDGLPIGEASVGLSSLMGEIVREVVPYTISDWRKVPPEMTEDLWKRIQVRYEWFSFNELSCVNKSFHVHTYYIAGHI